MHKTRFQIILFSCMLDCSIVSSSCMIYFWRMVILKARKWIKVHKSNISFAILDFRDFPSSSVLSDLRLRRSIWSRIELPHKIFDLCIEFAFDIDCIIFSEWVDSIDTIRCDTLDDLYPMRHRRDSKITMKLCSDISRKGIIDISLQLGSSFYLICMCHIFRIQSGFKIEYIHKSHRMGSPSLWEKLDDHTIWFLSRILPVFSHDTRQKLSDSRRWCWACRIEHTSSIRKIHPSSPHLTDDKYIDFSRFEITHIIFESFWTGIISRPPSDIEFATIFLTKYSCCLTYKLGRRYCDDSRIFFSPIISNQWIIGTHDPCIDFCLHKNSIKLFYRILTRGIWKSIHGNTRLDQLIFWTYENPIMDRLRERISMKCLSPYIFDTSPIAPEPCSRKSNAESIRKIREKTFSLICDIEICLITDDEGNIRRKDFPYTMIIALKCLDGGDNESSVSRFFSLLPECIVHPLLIKSLENSDLDSIFCNNKKVRIRVIECIFCSEWCLEHRNFHPGLARSTSLKDIRLSCYTRLKKLW